MAFPKSFCCKKSWSLLTGSKIIATTYMIFTAAVIGGLTFILMNDSTFQSLSKKQLSDYLLVGKALFPQAAYVDQSIFESNNVAYSSSTVKKNKSFQNTTTTAIPKKKKEINHQKNEAEIKSNRIEAESRAFIHGSNNYTLSLTTEKDNMDKQTTKETNKEAIKIEIESEATKSTPNSVMISENQLMKNSKSSPFKTETITVVTTTKTTQQPSTAQTSFGTDTLKEQLLNSSRSPNEEENSQKEHADLSSALVKNYTRKKTKKEHVSFVKEGKNEHAQSKVTMGQSHTKNGGTNEKNQPTKPAVSGGYVRKTKTTPKDSKKSTPSKKAVHNKKDKKQGDRPSQDGEIEPTTTQTQPKQNQKKINNVNLQTTLSVRTITNNLSSTGNSIEITDPAAIKIDFTTTSPTKIDNKSTFNVNQTTLIIDSQHQSHPSAHISNSSSVPIKSIKTDEISKISEIPTKITTTTYSTNVFVGSNSFITSHPNFNNKSTLNDNHTTIIDKKQSNSDYIQNSSSVSTKSLKTSDTSKISSIPTKVNITTNSTNIIVGNNSFITSQPKIHNKSISNGNQTTILTSSTVQNRSDDLQTSSTNKSPKNDESKNSINITTKITTMNSTNISKENSSVTNSSQNVSSTTLEVPINLLNQTLETPEETTHNEPKLKSSANKGKKVPRKFSGNRKNKTERSRISETKTDDDNVEPTTTEPTESQTFEQSTESTQSTAEAAVEIGHSKKKSRPPSVPDTKSEDLEAPKKRNRGKSSDHDQSEMSEADNGVNKKKRNKHNRNNDTTHHENPSDVKESNQDTLTTDFLSTTVSHFTDSMQIDVTLTTKSGSIRNIILSKKGKENNLDHAREKVSKEVKNENVITESHATTVAKGTGKKATATTKKKRRGTVGKLFTGGVQEENEIHTTDESVAATNHEHDIASTEQPTTIDKEKISEEENKTTVSAETHTAIIRKGTRKRTTATKKTRAGTDITLFSGEAQHLENENLEADKSVAHNDHSVATTKTPTTIGKEKILKEGNEVTVSAKAHIAVTVGKEKGKKTTTNKKKRRTGTVGKLFSVEALSEENGNLATEKSVTSTITDHSFATTDKTPITTVAQNSAKPTKHSSSKKIEQSEKVETNSDHREEDKLKGGKKMGSNKKPNSTEHPTVAATSDNKGTDKKSNKKNKAGARKHGNALLSFGGLDSIDHSKNSEISRRRRSSDSKSVSVHHQPSNHAAKSNNKANNLKANDAESLVNNILISGIALHGVYFGTCLLLIIGISKRSAGFVAPWLLAEFFRQLGILAIWGFLCYCTVDILSKDGENAKFAIPFCAVILVVIALTFYFWLVVCSLYKEFHGKGHQILPDEKGDPIDS